MEQRVKFDFVIPLAKDKECVKSVGPVSFMDNWRNLLERGLTGLRQFRCKKVLKVHLFSFEYEGPQSELGAFVQRVDCVIRDSLLTWKTFNTPLELHFNQDEVCVKGRHHRRVVYRARAQFRNSMGLVEEFVDKLCQALSQIKGLKILGKHPRMLNLHVNLYDSNCARGKMSRKAAVKLLKTMLGYRSLFPHDFFGSQFIHQLRLYRNKESLPLRNYILFDQFSSVPDIFALENHLVS